MVKVNLVVIRSADIHKAVTFYQALGMEFEYHSHGNGPKHYACEHDEFVFEIYPCKEPTSTTRKTRLGLSVGNVEQRIKELMILEVSIVSEVKISEWGKKAVVKDFDGHTVELVDNSEFASE